MKKTIVSLFLAVAIVQLQAQPVEKKDEKADEKAAAEKDAPKKQLEGLKFTGLPLISASSDDGFGYGARVFGTYYEPDVQPFRLQAYGQFYRTTRGFEYHVFSLDYLKAFGSPLRVRLEGGNERTLNAQWYGYGNYHDIQKIQKIKNGEIPINENTPRNRDFYKYTRDITLNQRILTNPTASLDNLNPPQRYLKDTQDKYFNYDRIRPFLNLSTENFICKDADSFVCNFKWFAGIRAQSFKIQSYNGDLEKGQSGNNIKTLIDNERPYGYDATEKKRYANGARVAAVYNSRPRARESNPNSGVFTDLHYEGVGKGTGSHYSYSRTTLTWRQYIDVAPSFFNEYNKEFVFAYRLLGQQADGKIPFFEAGRIYTVKESAEGLGGNGGVRGYPAAQFVDRVMAIANVEMRFTFAKTGWLGGMDWVLLGYHDEGRAGATKKEINGKNWHKANGGGVRLVWQKNTIVNISAGKSQYQTAFAFSFNHMF